MMNARRIFEPIFLGSAANMLINYLFDPAQPAFLLNEFVIAILLCVPITELNRYIDHMLERRYAWTVAPVKRFAYHLLLLLAILLISLNILGSSYMLLSGQGLFAIWEMFLINTVTFLLALTLTTTNWMIEFLRRWRKSELELEGSKQRLHNLKHKVNQSLHTIELQKGNKKIYVKNEQLRLAIFTHGLVWVYVANGERYLYNSTINELTTLLPGHLFFPVNRKAIIHLEMIQSISSGSHGKIELVTKTIDKDQQYFTISRLKAASFRNWLKSTSTRNL